MIFGGEHGSARIRVRLKSDQKPRAHYDAARTRRRLSGWGASPDSANAILAYDGELMRARARDVVRNNPYAASAADSFVGNLVGAGIKPSSLIDEPGLRDRIQRLWLAWTDEADADGMSDFYGLQALVARALFEAGECFVRFRARRVTDGYSVPLQLQVIESDLLDYTFNQQGLNGNWIINGIEVDARGARVAYHFWQDHPGDLVLQSPGSALRVRVPANEVMHIYRPQRPGQMRGAPWCAAAIVKLWQLDQYDDAELDRKKIAAMYAGFVTSPAPDEAMETDEQPVGSDGVVTLEPGTMQVLLPGEDVKFSTPAEVGGSYESFQYRNLLACFAAMGVPYALGTGDMRKANYSSLRGSIVEYRRRLEQAQHGVMVFQLCRPVWRRWLRDAVMAGALKIPGFAQNPTVAMPVKWIPPKFAWVDPLKDLQAEKLAVDSGFKSRSDVIEEGGYDPEETDRRIAADREREAGLGLAFAPAQSAPAAPDLDELAEKLAAQADEAA